MDFLLVLLACHSESTPTSGSLQIAYSGNLDGEIEPCG